MRVTMIKCDICKKEIEGNPFKFSVAQEDRTNAGELLDLQGEYMDESVKLYDYDYCPSCVRRMMRRLMGKPAITDPDFDQAVDEMIRESKEEKTEDPVDDVQEQQGQDSEPEPGQEDSKTVLQYFDEAKAAREEAEKQESSAKKKQARRSEKN